MSPLWMILFSIIAIAAIFFLAIHAQTRKWTQHYKWLARHLGCTLEPLEKNTFSMKGELHGHKISYSFQHRGPWLFVVLGRPTSICVKSVIHNPMPFSLKIAPRRGNRSLLDEWAIGTGQMRPVWGAYGEDLPNVRVVTNHIEFHQRVIPFSMMSSDGLNLDSLGLSWSWHVFPPSYSKTTILPGDLVFERIGSSILLLYDLMEYINDILDNEENEFAAEPMLRLRTTHTKQKRTDPKSSEPTTHSEWCTIWAEPVRLLVKESDVDAEIEQTRDLDITDGVVLLDGEEVGIDLRGLSSDAATEIVASYSNPSLSVSADTAIGLGHPTGHM